MGFWANLFRKQSLSRTVMSVQNLGQPVSSPRNYEAFSKEGYQNTVIAFRCIDSIAAAVADIPIGLYWRTGKKTVREIEEHPVLSLLKQPNPLQSNEEFLRAVTSFLLIAGNSYIEAAGGGDKFTPTQTPLELWPMIPSRLSVIPGGRGLPAAYKYKVGSVEAVTYTVDLLGRSNVRHMKTFHPTNDWYGLSPMEAAASGVDMLQAGAQWNLALLQNSCRPSGAFMTKTEPGQMGMPLTSDQRSQLRSDIDNIYSRTQNAGRPLLLEGNLSWVAMGLDPTDMDWLNGKKTSQVDVALAFNVPGQLVGIEGSQTFANYEQARLAFYSENVIPWCRFVITHLNNWLLPRFPRAERLFLAPDLDGVEALAPMRAARWLQVQEASWLTVNEKRELTGYGPYEPDESGGKPGDLLYISAGMIPLEAAALPPPAAVTVDPGDLGGGDPTQDDADPEGAEGEKSLWWAESAQNHRVKSWNVRGRAARLAFWRAHEGKRVAFERALSHHLKSHFTNEKAALVTALHGKHKGLWEYVVNDVLEAQKSELSRILKTDMRACAESFGMDILELAKSRPAPEQKSSGGKFESFLNSFLDGTVEEVSVRMTTTSQKRIMKKLRDIEESGLGADEMADAVIGLAEERTLDSLVEETLGDLYKSFTDSRAEGISRTYTHTAAQQGSLGAARSLSLPNLSKTWLASPDERTRDAHAAADGQTVLLHEQFNVGGEMLDAPGDPAGSPENIINCRCPMTYSTGDAATADEGDPGDE